MKKEKNIFMTNPSTSLKNDKDQIEYLTNQNKFYRTKLAQAAVKIQELKKGMRASKKGAVTYANYQESRIRHYHQTIDKYISKGPFKP